MILEQHPDHDYATMSVADLIVFAPNVVLQTGTNVATYGSPPDALTLITAAVAALNTANNAYIANPKLHAAVLTAKRALIKLLNRLAKYVDLVAGGSGAIIDLSGFHKTAAESTPTGKPVIATILDSYAEGKGGYYVHVKPQGKLASYIFILMPLLATVTISGNQYAVSMPCTIISDTHPTAEFANAPSGDQKLVVIVLNRAGLGPPTAPSTVSVP
jgi:hypothetical protein